MEKLPKRKSIRLSSDAYRHNNAFSITIATHKRYPWFSTYPVLAETTIDALFGLSSQRGADLFAWCLMPDHVHLLVQDRDIVEFVRRLKGQVTVAARRIDPGRKLWQRSFYDHGVRREESLASIAQYIWENPVRYGIVEKSEDYRWLGGSLMQPHGPG
jgi:putative transposase